MVATLLSKRVSASASHARHGAHWKPKDNMAFSEQAMELSYHSLPGLSREAHSLEVAVVHRCSVLAVHRCLQPVLRNSFGFQVSTSGDAGSLLESRMMRCAH